MAFSGGFRGAGEGVPEELRPGVIETRGMNVYYGDFEAVSGIDLNFQYNEISALIGPSGCGKSTVLRSLNRMNDLIPSARTEGEVIYHGENIYAPGVDPVEIRRRLGMVFQKPNPFPKSIYDNIAWGVKINGFKGSRADMDDVVQRALEQAALWDEVKDKLKESGLSLSGGQQQRLCIARAVATQPDVVLMDEPCSALDPIATLRIEELMLELKKDYSIIIVTHNMQQAARVSDRTAFFNVELDNRGMRTGHLVEFSPTDLLFTNPKQTQTEDYITGRFG
ncbi:MAG: phosphate ABC transporter ATP-binding protein [Actinobacteria bacterium]|nr:phosphate ABC transporter ATP-binding protein [Actinomycetota bacterium]